ncbi:hypothetical protein [Roseibium sp. RKSG952]|uniref:hypothetical protein n=1 Tax=Roseibium sp. RKSG952 TaxID=2529384 RepID=UPI0012BB8C11|nr:hypothetical protein [Roseibium sp. RKSG952]MTH95107.1 hypothetical protein [Roseibium sp. RKSG952]
MYLPAGYSGKPHPGHAGELRPPCGGGASKREPTAPLNDERTQTTHSRIAWVLMNAPAFKPEFLAEEMARHFLEDLPGNAGVEVLEVPQCPDI